MDGITPDCQSGTGCLIPDLPREGKRVLEIRSLISKLHNVIDPGTICQICDVDLIDLTLLAAVESELNEGTPHGEGH